MVILVCDQNWSDKNLPYGLNSHFSVGKKISFNQNIAFISTMKKYFTSWCQRHILFALWVSKQDSCECHFVQRERDYLKYGNKEIHPEVAIVMGTHPLHWHLLKCWKNTINRLNIKLYKIYWLSWYSKYMIYLYIYIISATERKGKKNITVTVQQEQ